MQVSTTGVVQNSLLYSNALHLFSCSYASPTTTQLTHVCVRASAHEMAFGNELPMAKKMAARKLFDEAEEAMGDAQMIIYGPTAAESGDAGCAPNQDDIAHIFVFSST